MGYAISYGITNKGVYKKGSVFIIESDLKRIKSLKKNKYKVFKNISIALKNNKKFDAIILAVKPNNISTVANELKNTVPKNTLIISIAAGITLKKLSSFFSDNKLPIARVMPNTPCQVGEGMSVITLNKNVSQNQKSIVKNIFQSLGKTIELQEEKLNLVTAVSGSGPAYFCYLIECMVKSAAKLGINEKQALPLVLQTAYGTTLLLLKHSLLPESLRKKVTSAKGTTEAALKVFQTKRFDEIVYSAVRAAKDRAGQLSKA